MSTGATILIVDADDARAGWLAGQVARVGAVARRAASAAAALADLDGGELVGAVLAVPMADPAAPALLAALGARGVAALVVADADARAAWSAVLGRGAAELVAWPVPAEELATRLRALAATRLTLDGALGARLLDSLPEPTAIVDARRVVIATNRAWRAGASPLAHGAVGERYLATDPSAHAAAITRAIARVSAGEAVAIEFEYPAAPAAALRWYACRIRRLDGDGPRGAVVSHVDVTATREAQLASTDNAERMQLLITTLPLVLWEAAAADGQFAVRWVSANAERVLGVPAAALTGPSGWIAHVHADDLPGLRSVDASGAIDQQWMEQYRWVRPDGGIVHLHAGVTTRAGGDGGTLIMGFALDVSEAKRLERRLLQVGKMDAVGQLTGGIAHDFNNLLAVILSFAGFVHADLPEGDDRRGDLDEVLRAASKGVELVRQLLVFSRQQPQAKRPLDVNGTLAALAKMLERTVGENIELVITPSPRAAVVFMDPVQLDQVVMNLTVNARDAMPHGGTLRLAIATPAEATPRFAAGRYVRLTVADTGVGMDASTAARIFEPFFTTKGVGHGTGLGLATCDAIVHDAGGTIAVDSVPGRGTAFVIDLPVCDLPVEDVAAPAGVTAPTGDERVLVVEDDVALRRAAVRILESAGYRVSQVGDGEEAMRWLDDPRHAVDLIFSDVVMPRASGYAVASHARARMPAARVLLTSGYLDGRAVPQPDLEGLPLLWKPYTPASLLRAARDALRQPSARLPAVTAGPPAAPPASEPGGAAGATAGGRVLIIEDDELIAVAHRRILTRHGGFDVAMAETIADARQALDGGQDFAAILCDLTLPDGSGAELVAWLRDARPDLAARVVVLTGGAVDGASRALVAAGEVEVLHKPVDPDRLVQCVAALASRADAAPRRQRTTALGVLLPTGTTGRPPVRGEPDVPPAAPAAAARGAAVLLVEDDLAQRNAYARALRGAEFRVTAVASGEEAMASLAQHGVDAVVADIGLPGMDGLALVGAAHARDPELPVLLITGARSQDRAEEAIRSGAAGYLVKPFGQDALVRELTRAVATCEVARLRRKLLATRRGTDELVAAVAAPGAGTAAWPIAYQPVVRSHDHSLYGFAVQPGGAPASPDARRAIRDAIARTLADHPDRREAIFVDLPPDELRPARLGAAAEPLRAHAARVVLVVSARTLVVPTADELRALRAAGYRIALAELGDGEAAVRALTALPPELARIDLAAPAGAPAARRAVLAALVNACRHRGITTLAEGADTSTDVDLATDLGFDLIQGRHVAPPGPPFPTVPGG